MMFGLHMTLAPDKLTGLAQLRKRATLKCPKGIEVVEEYVWGLKFLIVIVRSDSLTTVLEYAQQFSTYITDLEVGAVTTLRELGNR